MATWCHGIRPVGGRLYAWDWEGSTPDVPLGFDAVHFYYSVAFIAERRPLGEAVQIAADRAAEVLGALGIAAPARPLIAILHLIELAIRHDEARRGTGETDDRFYPAVTQVLAGGPAPAHGFAGPQPTGRAA